MFKPKIAEVDVTAALERLRDRKQIRFQESGGSIAINGKPTIAHTDPEALETILENLVDNTLKYTTAAPRVEVSAERREGLVLVHVTDNGIGMSAGDAARIFDKFYRADAGQETHAKGTGLGLFISRRLARACGGDLKVHSAGSGQGCTFTLELTQ